MKIRSRKFTRIELIGLVIIGMCWGCTGLEHKIDSWQSAVQQKFGTNASENKHGRQSYFIHTARWSWETMYYVAEWYTGDDQNLEAINELNQHVNPRKIAVGTKIRIPYSLLKTRKPLPQNYITESDLGYYRHIVRWPGESLSLIASWYTGSSKNWRQLAKNNPRLNPDQIKNGNVVMIPTFLMQNRAPLPQKEAAKYTPHYFSYTVKRDNEKLADIAKRFTGSSANRKHLAKANPDINPNHLVKGNEVYIPKELLKGQNAIPASKPPPAASKSTVKSPKAETEKKPPQDEKIKLFGPKQFPKS